MPEFDTNFFLRIIFILKVDGVEEANIMYEKSHDTFEKSVSVLEKWHGTNLRKI